jgi:hypothetical protein
MPSLDPSPWLLVFLPAWAGLIYVTYRGLDRNEFRKKGSWGWFHYETWSLDWFLSTLVNFSLLAAFTFIVSQLLFHGSTFFERDAPEVHCVEGAEMVTTDACSVE